MTRFIENSSEILDTYLKSDGRQSSTGSQLKISRREMAELSYTQKVELLCNYKICDDEADSITFKELGQGQKRDRSFVDAYLGHKVGNYTAVLNVWKRPPEQFFRQLQCLLNQSLRPKEIWVCAFGLTEDEAKAYKCFKSEFNGIPIFWFYSDFNLKYHGRFEIAMSAKTEFVAFIDDDIIPGRYFLEQCFGSYQQLHDAGEVGIYGFEKLPSPLIPGSSYTSGTTTGHQENEEWLKEHQPVDFLWGFHFLKTEHLRYLFLYAHTSLQTAEDFQIAAALRSYLGLKSYALAVDKNDPNTWGLSEDWRDIRDGATTHGEMDKVRQGVYRMLSDSGVYFQWMSEYKDVLFNIFHDDLNSSTSLPIGLTFDIPITRLAASRGDEDQYETQNRARLNFFRNGHFNLGVFRNFITFVAQHSNIKFCAEGAIISEFEAWTFISKYQCADDILCLSPEMRKNADTEYALKFFSGFVVTQTNWKANLVVAKNDFIGSSVISSGSYEPDIQRFIRFCLRPNDVFVDVGANIGVHSIFASTIVGDGGTVYSFEPVKKTYEVLLQNIRLNSLTNINAINKGISCIAETIPMKIPEGNLGGATRAERLFDDVIFGEFDAISRQLPDLNRLRLMKVDVEGMEMDVLKSSSVLIADFRPIMIVEYNLETGNRELIFSFFDEMAYVCFIISFDGKTITFNRLQTSAVASHSENLIAIPSEATASLLATELVVDYEQS